MGWQDDAIAGAPAAPAPKAWETDAPVGPTPQQKAVTSANDNGEEAAKALQISKRTGIPAPTVQSDLPGYGEHDRRQSAIKAVQNPFIAKYIDGNPMAAKVSGDDYDKLDEVSQTLQALHPELMRGKAQAGVFAAIPEIAGMLGTGPGREKLFNAAKELPGALGKGLLDFFQTPGKVASGEINLNTPGGLEQGIGFGIGVALGGRDIRVGRPKGMEGVEGGVPLTSFDDFMATIRGMKTRKEIDDFIASKQEGPPGAALQIEYAKAGSEALDKAMETAQTSKTRERSPELFAEAAEAHDPGNVHVDGAKLMELYQKEGKVPAPGDGLLGDVPGIAGKIAAAEATGGEVTIPVSQYIAHVDPTVHEGLKESVRLHDDGVTLEEAKEHEDAIKAFDPEAPVEPEPTEPTAIEQKSLGLDTRVFMNMEFENAKALGITETEFKAYSDKIARQEQAVLDKAVAMNKAEIARALTPEWKRQETAVRDEVINEFKTSGPFMAEKYLRENKIDLAHERAAEVAEGLAPLFGYENGQDLLRGLEGIETERAASGKGPQVQLRDAIKEKTARRMEERHGVLAENIAKEARQMALSEHTFDVLADEVRILSKASGLAPPLSRSEMVDWAKQSFEGSNVVEAANWEKHRRAVERGGREAEKALLKGDFAEAFLAKQRQMLAAIVAKESLAFGKVVNSVERKIDRFSTEETIKGMDQTHLEQYRQVLASVGLPQHFAPLVGTGTLRDFVTESQGQLAVAPWLMDGSQPKLQDMSVAEFRDFAKSLQSIEHVGRQAGMLDSAMGRAELQNVVFDIKKELDRFDLIEQPLNPSVPQRIKAMGRWITAAHLLVERMLDYTDKFSPEGPLTRFLDRPLRDSNTKEIQLTENISKQLRAFKQYTDSSVNDKIPNNLIPDTLTASGFLNMDRGNLRQLMLHMGNWSNIKKVVEGFGVNEADLRRFIDQAASEKDWKWVQGMWNIFADLKVEADAMQLRDTGVPADTLEPVPMQTKFGEVSGGYAPLVYDKARSNIQGDIAAKDQLFGPNYVQATTPHGYTISRTQYQGPLDLTGALMATKIQAMIHDIAFREAVRNASRLINNEEFMAEMTKKWSKEYAGLLPGWLRDIANVASVDDSYAMGASRVMAGLRQNITSGLIALNPGTYLKHGVTAGSMSIERVGAGAFASASKELGLKSIFENARDLIRSTDSRPEPEFISALQEVTDPSQRGEDVRQFILDSSAVMRARQRKFQDSIRGAYETASESGPVQSAKDFRHAAMNFGRFPVALSDAISAMPTWLAAYKKAVADGADHTDAVFQAEKEVSRAHGSGFIGDKPRVQRTGELMRWITPLYTFWNHMANNYFQAGWDMAGLGNAKRAEPNANVRSLSNKLFWLVVIPLVIEEMAGPAKDEDGHGIAVQSLKAIGRHFGSSIIGLRDITNAALGGYDPSIGMTGILLKTMADTGKDIQRLGTKGAATKNWLIHSFSALAAITGVGGAQVGRTANFLKDLVTGTERPSNFGHGLDKFNSYRQGLRTGHSKARIHR